MAKLTLLEIVQDILNDADSDEVNSIDDTVESRQVAQVVKTSYFEIIGNRNWPHLEKLIIFDSLSDISRPTHIRIPLLVKEMVGDLNYNITSPANGNIDKLKKLTFKDPEAFLRIVYSVNTDATNIQLVSDFSGAKFYVYTDKAPTYWTSIDNEHIIFDSYDSTAGATVLGSRTQGMAYVEPSWTHVDSFIPDLPSEAFPALLEEAKSTAFIVLKQMANQKAEQKSTRQQRWLSRKAWKAHGGINYPNYGRTSKK